MADSLNVIALISGGKDSFFSLLHCIHNGHKIVALANLYPPESSLSSRSSDLQVQVETGFATREGSDLNSFMYQTVGHSLIPLYSTALRLPLYRRQITGTSIQQSQYYDSSSSAPFFGSQDDLDETEDLVPLLRQVISAHPEANSISTGAILSTYQRTRVESIAVRLGLTPLSYLWQYPILPPPVQISPSAPQTNSHRPDSLTGLLQDAASAGLDSRIIKIASAGISENLLLANVADAQTQSHLIKGLAPFFEDYDELGLRGAVLGEGGEYETITVSGPKDVWIGGRIELDEHADESYTEGGVIYACLSNAKVIPHEAIDVAAASNSKSEDHRVLQPALFDPQFVKVMESLQLTGFDFTGIEAQKCMFKTSNSDTHLGANDPADDKLLKAQLILSQTVTASSISINNLTSQSIRKYSSTSEYPIVKSASSEKPTASSMSSTAQLQTIVDDLPVMLAKLSQTLNVSLSTANISSTSLLLRSMSDFAAINPIYSQMYPLGLPNPPARVTIAAPLPSSVDVSLCLTLNLSSRDRRQGLHVQGRSYWAPANIGPYSQAISTPLKTRSQWQSPQLQAAGDTEAAEDATADRIDIVYVAGQIPLIPSSMQVYTGSCLDAAVLGLQHLWRVGQERCVDIWPWGVAYLAEYQEFDIKARAKCSAVVWKQAHVESTWSSDPVSNTDDDDESQQSDSEESPDFDIWNIQQDRSLHHGFRQSRISIGKHLHILPNHSLFSDTSSYKEKYVPPFVAAELTALPRNANIEWWSSGIAKLAEHSKSRSNFPRPEWQFKTFQSGSLSCLTIPQSPTQPHQTVKFITYLVSHDQASSFRNTTHFAPPITTSSILHLLRTSQDNSPPVSKSHLVQGTAFITTSAFESNVWDHFTSTTNQLEKGSGPFDVSQSQEDPLYQGEEQISNVAMIPCHRLWGHGASAISANRRNIVTDETQRQEHHNHDIPIEEICIAFLLRVETT